MAPAAHSGGRYHQEGLGSPMTTKILLAVAIGLVFGLAAVAVEAGCDPNNQCPAPRPIETPTTAPTPAPIVEPSPEEETPPSTTTRDPHPQQCTANNSQPFAPGQCATHPPTVVTYTPCQLALQAFLQHRLTVADVLSICNRQPLPAPPRTDLPPNLRLPNAGS